MTPLPQELRLLLDDQFEDRHLVFLPTHAMKSSLASDPDVQRLIAALQSGVISDQSIRSFVAMLMKDFRIGVAFRHELALAALAVALSTTNTQVATEYVRNLSRVSASEVTRAASVAKECLLAILAERVTFTRHYPAAKQVGKSRFVPRRAVSYTDKVASSPVRTDTDREVFDGTT